MPLTVRPYAGTDDLQEMKALLTAGKQAFPYSYAHPGDLDWWVFYDTSGVSLHEKVRLWEDERGQVVGWTFATLRRCSLDLFVHPQLRGTSEEKEIILRSADWIGEIARQQPAPVNGERTIAMFPEADHASYIGLLEERGFVGEPYIVFQAQSLDRPLPEARLPEGFTVLPRMRLEYADQRADVHAHSFNPSKMTPDYYRGFMQAPGYDPELDTVVVAPNGRFAAFAMGWVDPVTRIANFEPVGTRDEFQRRGLGKAVLREGMRRLQARGMQIAIVGCMAENVGNRVFYESVGFKVMNTVLRYSKVV
jgi:ribosomal protein S18 acetylase RimI-like enzyme